MTAPLYQVLLARAECHRHLFARARRRGIAITCGWVAGMERRLDALRPAFEMPGKDRYLITVKRGRERLRIVFDTRLGCLVTVWSAREGRRPPQTRRRWKGDRGWA